MVNVYSEWALVAIAPQGYGDLNFQSKTESIDIDYGERGVEFIPTLKPGRLTVFTPQEETTVSLDLYTVEAGTQTWPDQTTTTVKDATGIFDLMDGSEPGSMPIVIEMGKSRLPIRLTILLTDDTSVDSAVKAVSGSGKKALRAVFADGYITSIKPSYSDKRLKLSVEAKFPPYDEDGNPCIKFESTNDAGTSNLSALNPYTSSQKW